MSGERTRQAFPVDDTTLDMLEAALGTVYGDIDPETGKHERVGGPFMLSEFLNFMSGYNEDWLVPTDDINGIPAYEYTGPALYTERGVIKALITEVRRLRALAAREGDDHA